MDVDIHLEINFLGPTEVTPAGLPTMLDDDSQGLLHVGHHASNTSMTAHRVKKRPHKRKGVNTLQGRPQDAQHNFPCPICPNHHFRQTGLVGHLQVLDI